MVRCIEMTFSLITDKTYYKKVVTRVGGGVVGGIYNKGTEVITYEPFVGNKEPFEQGEESFVLPEGVTSRDAKILFSPEDLKVHTSTTKNASVADVVYFTNPETNLNAEGYVVWDKEVWDELDGNFTMIDNYQTYICIREAKRNNL